MKKLILSFVFLLSSAFAMESENLLVNHHDKQFIIMLPSNPTTGYQWVVRRYDQKILKLVSSHSVAAKKNLIGASGHIEFVFSVCEQASYPKKTLIEFNYKRSWETDIGDVKVIKVTLK